MEEQTAYDAEPGSDWAPPAPATKERRAHKDLVKWQYCSGDNCRVRCWEKVEAGYYPRIVGKEGVLSKGDEHQENVFDWTKVVRNTHGPPPRTMVLFVPLVHSWSTLIQVGPLRVTTPRKLRTKVDQGGPGGPQAPWSGVLDQEHCGPVFTFC